MIIWILSDTHMRHAELVVPQADMVIHCGDFSNKANPYENEIEARNFLEWYKVLPIETKILICGNHDTSCFKKLIRREEYSEIIWLEHETANVKGLNIFGSPYSPRYGDWAYMYKRNRGDVYWSSIPENTDILICHTMPKGILDLCDDERDRKFPYQAGCKALYNRIIELKHLKLFCGGHLHSTSKFHNFGILKHKGIDFINAACYNHGKDTVNQGHLIEL